MYNGTGELHAGGLDGLASYLDEIIITPGLNLAATAINSRTSYVGYGTPNVPLAIVRRSSRPVLLSIRCIRGLLTFKLRKGFLVDL